MLHNNSVKLRASYSTGCSFLWITYLFISPDNEYLIQNKSDGCQVNQWVGRSYCGSLTNQITLGVLKCISSFLFCMDYYRWILWWFSLGKINLLCSLWDAGDVRAMMLCWGSVMQPSGREGAESGHQKKIFQHLSTFHLISEEQCSCWYLQTVLKLNVD